MTTGEDPSSADTSDAESRVKRMPDSFDQSIRFG